MWKTVFFDFDGTLVDTGEGIKSCLRYAMDQMGHPMDPEEDLDRYIGPPFRWSLQAYAGLSEAETEEAIRIYRERYGETGLYESHLYPGIETALQVLKAEGERLCVVSSKPQAMILKLLEYYGLASYFDLVLGADPEGRLSKKADLIAEALKRLGLEDQRDSVVFVGDRKYDMEGAAAQGIPAIGVLYGYGSFEELTAYEPARLAESPMMVLSVIEKENARETTERTQERGFLSHEPAGMEAEGTNTDSSLVPDRVKAPDGVALRIWRIAYPILIYEGIAYGIIILASLLLGVLIGLTGNYEMSTWTSAWSMAAQGIGMAITLPLLILFFKRDQVRRCLYPLPQGIYQKRLTKGSPKAKPVLMTVLLIYFLGNGVGFLIMLTQLASVDTTYQQSSEVIVSLPVFWQVVIVGILGPVVEEFIFRGLVQRRLRDYNLGKWPAVLITAALFGIYHLNFVQGIFAFVIGLVLGLLYEKYGVLWIPILAHMVNNIWSTLSNSLFPVNCFFNTIFFYLICLAGMVVMLILIFRKKKGEREAGYPWTAKV